MRIYYVIIEIRYGDFYAKKITEDTGLAHIWSNTS